MLHLLSHNLSSIRQLNSAGSWHLLEQEQPLSKDILSRGCQNEANSCPIKKKSKLTNAILSQQPLLPIKIGRNHSYFTNNFTKAVICSFNPKSPTICAEIKGPACSHRHPGGLWTLWGNTNSAPGSCSPQRRFQAEKHLPEDVGNKGMILLQLQREPSYQNSMPRLKLVSHHYKDGYIYFSSQLEIPGIQQHRAQVLLWLSLSARDTGSLFYRIDQSPFSKASLCFGSVWLSSAAKRRSSTGLVTQTSISPRNILTAMHLEKCLKY